MRLFPALLLLSGCIFIDGPTFDARLDLDQDGSPYPDDCAPDDGSIYPGAPELCDGVDQDCDGEVDEGVEVELFVDGDGDGFGNAGLTFVACEGEEGLVSNDDDCDDGDSTIHPGATEICDGVDQDCDGVLDPEATTWYTDEDGDGYGAGEVEDCEQPDRTAEVPGDCNDSNANVNPGEDETCDDVDEDCDAIVDEDAEDAPTWYADVDGDGQGDAGDSVTVCAQPEGHVANADDCDDSDGAIYLGAAEVCDALDNDCDCLVDDDADDTSAWYTDLDEDGYGEDGTETYACDQPTGSVALAGDCDDLDAAYHPGAGESDCSDPNDYNCDGSVAYTDSDGDGYPACEDCDDVESAAHPGGIEICDGLDNDCDGQADNDALDATLWYADLDGDTFGDLDGAEEACEAPADTVANADDCDDTDVDTFPEAPELCDAADNDCDGDIDEDGASTFYADMDGDGFGDPDVSEEACEAPSDYVIDDTDCDDTNPDVSPGGLDICDADALDEDCDGDANPLDAADCTLFYEDSDSDGYGEGEPACYCSATTTYPRTTDTDCDSANPAVNPGVPELCDNGIDEDCDGGAPFCVLDDLGLASADARYLGIETSSYAGYSVSLAGDLNADGYADMIVGAPYNSTGAPSAGTAYVILGTDEPTSMSLADAIAYSSSVEGGSFGIGVSAVGDVNGDAYDDVLVGPTT